MKKHNSNNKKISNNTIQKQLIHFIDTTENSNKEALKDIDSRLYDLIFAYSGNLDYGSLQVLEGCLKKNLDHLLHIKEAIAKEFINKNYLLNPGLKDQVEKILNQNYQTKRASLN